MEVEKSPSQEPTESSTTVIAPEIIEGEEEVDEQDDTDKDDDTAWGIQVQVPSGF